MDLLLVMAFGLMLVDLVIGDIVIIEKTNTITNEEPSNFNDVVKQYPELSPPQTLAKDDFFFFIEEGATGIEAVMGPTADKVLLRKTFETNNMICHVFTGNYKIANVNIMLHEFGKKGKKSKEVTILRKYPKMISWKVHYKSQQSEGEKSQGEKSQGEKSQGEKSQDEKSQGEKSQGEKSQSEKSQSEKSQGEKSQGEKSKDEKHKLEVLIAGAPGGESGGGEFTYCQNV